MPRSTQTQKRRRGIILSPSGWQRLQTAQKALEAQQNGFNPFTIEQLVELTGLSHNTLTKVRSGSAPVDRQTLNTYFNSLGLTLITTDYLTPVEAEAPNALTPSPPIPPLHQDWGEAPHLEHFFGRDQELQFLQTQLLANGCRVMGILGQGGMGKTSLALKLAHRLAPSWEFIIWRTLRTPVPLKELLSGWIPFLSGQQASGTSIRQLIECLRRSTCLVILDNVESVLKPGISGHYRAGYEDYGDLIQVIGETQHGSCLLLTSREKPPEVSILEGEGEAVQTLTLSGSLEASLAIVETKGLKGNLASRTQLCQQYGHNPLAIKIVSSSITELFNAEITPFLAQETIIFNGIRRLFTRQFDRLSDLELKVMNWLAINGVPSTIDDLFEDLLRQVPKTRIFEAIESLKWRSLIESSAASYSLQPVVLEYVLEGFIEQLVQQLIQGDFSMLRQYALLKATAKDTIQNHQADQVLLPICQQFSQTFSSPDHQTHHIQTLIQGLRQGTTGTSGYAVGNLINLGQFLHLNLSGWDFSDCLIRQADLRTNLYYNLDFSRSTLEHTAFLENFGGILQLTALSSSRNRDHTSSQLITTDTLGQIQLWKLPEFTLMMTRKGHESWVWAIAVSTDQCFLATAGVDRQVNIWKLDTGQCIQQIPVEDCSFINSLAFSPDNTELAIGGATTDVLILDIKTAKLSRLTGHQRYTQSVRYSPDGSLLATGGYDSIRIWRVCTKECLYQLPVGEDFIGKIEFHPDGQTLATGSNSGIVRIWDLHSYTCIAEGLGHQDMIRAMSYSPDGTLIATGSCDCTLRLWDSKTGTCLKTFVGHQDHVYAVDFILGNQRLVSGSTDQTIRIWNTQTGQSLHTICGYVNQIYGLDAYKNRLATGSTDGYIRIWDTQTQQCLKAIQDTGWIWSVAWNPDGSLLARGGWDGKIKLWHWERQECIRVFSGHQTVLSVLWHPVKNILASGSMDCTVRLWDVDQGHCITCLAPPSGTVGWTLSLAWSPDLKYLACGRASGVITIWDINTYSCVQTIEAHQGYIWSLDWHSNGKWLLSAGGDCLIQLWDVETGKSVKTLTGHQNQVAFAQFDRQESIILSCSADKTVRLWNAETGLCLNTLNGHTQIVFKAMFIEGEATIASCSEDGTVRLWDREQGECTAVLEPKPPYAGFNMTGTKGLSPGQINTCKALGAVGLCSENIAS